jgi:hypothetical protein
MIVGAHALWKRDFLVLSEITTTLCEFYGLQSLVTGVLETGIGRLQVGAEAVNLPLPLCPYFPRS